MTIRRDTILDIFKAIRDAVQGTLTTNSTVQNWPTTQNTKAVGSIPEYLWLTGDAEPAPGDDGFTRAMGAEIDPASHEITIKYWTGTAWQEVA